MVQPHDLWVPFQLSEGREINLKEPFYGNIRGCTAELTRGPEYYVLHLKRLPSEAVACAEFSKIIDGLYWNALEMGCGILVSSSLQDVQYFAEPIVAAKNMFGEDRPAVELSIDGNRPAIWPSEKKRATLTGYSAKFRLGKNPSKFFEVLDAEIWLRDRTPAIPNPRLKHAIELYCLSHFRASDFARFLILCTVLETVSPQPEMMPAVRNLVDEFIDLAKASALDAKQASAEREELAYLAERLGYLKIQSHRGRIQKYVRETLQADGATDVEETAREVRRLYDLRGKLTHEGHHSIGDDLSNLDKIVCRTLRAAMKVV